MDQNGFDAITADDEWESDDRPNELARTVIQGGWEIAKHIDRIAEAMTDFDPVLTTDCLRKLDEVVGDAGYNAVLAYLDLAALYADDPDLEVEDDYWGEVLEPPGELDRSRWPVVPREGVRKGTRALVAQTSSCTDLLHTCATWIDEYLAAASRWYDDDQPGARAVLIASNIVEVRDLVRRVVDTWHSDVIRPHRKLASGLQGLHPPAFVAREAALQETFDDIAARFGRRGPSVA
ncbi:hypothetical protein ACWDUM_26090 [Rhodococcus sp. NPDC003322]